MSKEKPIIHIYVRHCYTSTNSTGKERPTWFNKEAAFKNLLETSDDAVKITVLLDTAGKDAVDPDHFVFKYQSKVKAIIQQQGGSDAHSFRNLLDYVLENKDGLTDSDIVYILEEDYVHMAGWCDAMREVFKELQDEKLKGVDYVTLYDHPDKYTDLYKGLESRLMVIGGRHWRITPSTTNTYACTFRTLRVDKHLHYRYAVLEDRFTYDHQKFLHLAKIGKKLASCIPGMSTHCESAYLSPGIEWNKLF